jgi:hypothetical protein
MSKYFYNTYPHPVIGIYEGSSSGRFRFRTREDMLQVCLRLSVSKFYEMGTEFHRVRLGRLLRLGSCLYLLAVMSSSFEFADSPWWLVACTVLGLPLDSVIDRTILEDNWCISYFLFLEKVNESILFDGPKMGIYCMLFMFVRYIEPD